MTERGATHLKALCVVAARLAERAWLTLSRGDPYTIRDLDGTPTSGPQHARAIIERRFTVPPEIRRRRRSTKQAGRTPQHCEKQEKSRHAAGHEAAHPTNTITTTPRQRQPTDPDILTVLPT
jgi:hypothetical protein